MADASPPDTTGTAPAIPGASPPVTPPETPVVTPPIEAVAPVIPEKYEFKLDEGRSIDSGLIEAVSPILKELNATQESAQKLVDAYDKYGQVYEAAQEKQFQDFLAKTEADNLAAMKKEWGADYNPKLTIAQRGIARFLSDAGKQKLKDSGLGNDPEFMKAFYQVGKMIQEDQPPINGKPAFTKPATLEQALYGKH